MHNFPAIFCNTVPYLLTFNFISSIQNLFHGNLMVIMKSKDGIYIDIDPGVHWQVHSLTIQRKAAYGLSNISRTIAAIGLCAIGDIGLSIGSGYFVWKDGKQ